MCIQQKPYNHADQMYVAQEEWMQNYIQHTILPPIENGRAQGGIQLLMELQTGWQKFQRVQSLFCKYFRYLDRFYVRHNELQSIRESATQIFRNSVDEDLLNDAAEVLRGGLVQFLDNRRRDETEGCQRDGNLMDAKIFENMDLLNEIMGESLLYQVKNAVINASVKYHAEIWMAEENNGTSIEEFVSTTEQKVIKEIKMLEEEYSLKAFAEPRAEDIVTKGFILEELILCGIDHERNEGYVNVEAVRQRFKIIFDAYEQNERPCESRLRHHFVQTSRKYFAQLRAQWSEKSAVQYMMDVEQVLGNEAYLISYYIREKEWVERIIQAAREELVVNYAKALLVAMGPHLEGSFCKRQKFHG
eukprot:CAMPEP_0203667162 /NCGR_PEP_ID=MMETSP0090-20130426/4048_1 /ASSEMBLY_ACC=CAM_ASM_001088 /TAXON_ID=426623 /ORGANISM="Chaetoceros affinis, Strain CCMP159" /LENGTH=359 /DNA_ID=CAMNT_0050531245 /DNA_START=159 /DNA_END=1238 /DNA_ORIENTATION=+